MQADWPIISGKGSTWRRGFAGRGRRERRGLPSADGFEQMQPARAAPPRGQRGLAGFVEPQDVNSGEAAVNNLQQLLRVQIGQPAIQQQQLAFAAFQLAQSIGPAQGLGGNDPRKPQVLHDLPAQPGVGAGDDNGWIRRITEIRGVVMRVL